MKRWAFVRFTDYSDGTAIVINLDKIRAYYERSDGGVNIDVPGGFYRVKESVEEVNDLIQRVGA